MKTARADLTVQEQDCVRVALRFLRIRIGGWEQLSKVLGFKETTLTNVTRGRTASASLAFRIARFVGVGVDNLLAGKFPPSGTCPYCGHCAESTPPAESAVLK